jgi:hypothetical protein
MVALSRQFSNTPPPERPNRRKLVLDRQEMSEIEGLLSEREPEK